jgi:hypothetical protein
MNRPFPLPSDIEAKQLRPSAYVVRAASASLRSFLTGASAVSTAKSMWDDDRVTPLILRAATGPALTTQSDWAKELAGVAIYDLVQSVTSLSAAAEVIDRALKINLDGIAEAHVPGRNLAPAGAWVAEGQPTPVRAFSFSNAAILIPRRLSIVTVVTREMAESSNIEAILRQTLGEETALSLDQKMFSADAPSANAPGGLFAGIASQTPTAGGGDNAMHGDLALLFGALAAKGGGKTAAIIAALPQAVRLKMAVGPKFDYDIIASTALAPGTVAVLEVASLVSGFGSVAEFTTSKVAAVHMEDTSPADFPAAPMKSLFQVDAIALKTNVWAAWGLRAAGHCQYLTGATW